MRVLVAADSRGQNLGPKYSWISLVEERHPEHDYWVRKKAAFTTIFDHVDTALAYGIRFDCGIVQLGYHDMGVPWKKAVFRQYLPEQDPEWETHLTLCPQLVMGAHVFVDCYRYKHDEAIRQQFTRLRSVCPKLLFIQMPYSYDIFAEATRDMNKVFGSCCDAVLDLPQDDKNFPGMYTVDNVHYCDVFAIELAQRVCDWLIAREQ